MSDYPSPDIFDTIEVKQTEHDYMLWRVVGVKVGDYAISYLDIEEGFQNKALAEAFLKMYTEEYIKKNFFS